MNFRPMLSSCSSLLHRSAALLMLTLCVLTAWGQQTHTVQRGETLFGIARQYQLTVTDLQRLNNLDGTTLSVGQVLVVAAAPPTDPAAPLPGRPPAAAPADAPTYGTHTVRPGDTYYALALSYGLTVDTLVALNGPKLWLEPGEALRLPPSLATVEYIVRRGDTLFRIARNQGVTVAAIRTANGLASNTISVGQRLRIPLGGGTAAPGTRRLPPMMAKGTAVPYPETFAGRVMAGGKPYDPARFTVSHPTLPLGTLLLLRYPETDRSTFAEVADRAPLNAPYLLDISGAVARQLGITTEEATLEVRVMPLFTTADRPDDP